MEEAVGPSGTDVVVDSAVLVAADRGSRNFSNFRAALAATRRIAVVPAPVVTEVWRDGSRQANLARALGAMRLADCTEGIAKRAGRLLEATAGSNTIDATVVATAEAHACGAVSADVEDLRALADHSVSVGIEPF